MPSLKNTLSAVRTWARRIQRDGLMLWFACRDPRTPWWLNGLAFFVVERRAHNRSAPGDRGDRPATIRMVQQMREICDAELEGMPEM